MATAINTTVHADESSWLAAKQAWIGASEAPVVLGVSPYSSPLKLWSEKTGRIERQASTAIMRRGNRLEQPVAEMVADETGWTLTDNGRYAVCKHPEIEWMGCTLDRIIEPIDERGPGNLQIKTADWRTAHLWDNGIPLHVAVQVQHELAVTGYTWGVVAVLFGIDDMRRFEFSRNERFIAAMIASEHKFMEHIWTDTPPPLDGSEATADAINRLYPRKDTQGIAVDLPAESADWDERLLEVKKQIKELESEKTELESRIKSAIGEATFGLLPHGGRYQWRQQQRSYEARAAYTTTFSTLSRMKK